MNNQTEIAVFGGGCFWCTEAVFKMLKGVMSVEPGYSGGAMPNPTYEQVCSGNTGHAEVVKIEYDPAQVKYRTLLTIFFASHDSTQLNRQGADVGTQYRSVIFYTTEQQREEALKFIEELNSSSEEGSPVVTEITPLDNFYPAENYHRDYYAKNKDQSYCQIIIAPKLQKVQKEFAELLK
ncbi:MAG: peptide-methionine (S)-S-oxide reductase [Parcubacteria group bacterium Gr01-1014_3]|nr:MAG: peptide-methionine (S)-S-oxide reductase [Parcubacteria group bacterium Gr01-1014_3]